ncbi:MAG: hypothetical protein IJ275_00085 [Ruminococcus sp.]|nr:hypothetical protein [Ruminococcus sp.]
MKKLLTLVMALVMALTITVSATAATFVPSIENKGAPQLIILDENENGFVVGYITDKEGNKITTEYLDCFIITSITDALDKNSDVPEDIRKELTDLYKEICDESTKISDLCPDLDEIVKEKWGKDKTADDLVIKDFFDISGECDEIKEHLSEDGSTIELTFDVGVAGDTFITAMVYVDGKWQPVVDTINNGDGTVTVKFSQICPVAFLVPGTGENASVVSPTTADTSSVLVWAGIMALSLVAIIALVIYRRKVNG